MKLHNIILGALLAIEMGTRQNADGETTKDGEASCRPRVVQKTEQDKEYTRLIETFQWKLDSGQESSSSTGSTGSSNSITGSAGLSPSGPSGSIGGTSSDSSSDSTTGGTTGNYRWVLVDSSTSTEGAAVAPSCPSPRLVGSIIGPNFAKPGVKIEITEAGYFAFKLTITTTPWWRIHDCICPE